MLADVVNGKNVRMVQRRSGPRLLLEATEAIKISGECRRQNFNGDVSREPGIPRPIHLTHTPCTNGSEDFIRAEAGAVSKRHPGERSIARSYEKGASFLNVARTQR